MVFGKLRTKSSFSKAYFFHFFCLLPKHSCQSQEYAETRKYTRIFLLKMIICAEINHSYVHKILQKYIKAEMTCFSQTYLTQLSHCLLHLFSVYINQAFLLEISELLSLKCSFAGSNRSWL